MQAMLDQKQPLSKLAEPVTIYPQLLKNIQVTDKDAAMNAPSVLKAKEEAEEMLQGDGRVLLRKSGTEPLIRVMVEAPDKKLCEKCVDHIADAIQALQPGK